MNKLLLAATAAAAAIALTPAAAQAQDADNVSVSFSLTGATDYVWRGVSQSNEDPAVFATAQVSVGGFYVGAGTENVRFAGIEQEYDLWAGYAVSLGGSTKLDVGVVRYGYVDAPTDIDTLEVKAALSTKVGKLGLSLTGYHTWDYFGTGENATYVEATISYPLMDKLTASATLGRQQIDNLPDYTTWNIGLEYAVAKNASLAVRYHDTDTAAFGTLGDSRVTASFSLNF